MLADDEPIEIVGEDRTNRVFDAAGGGLERRAIGLPLAGILEHRRVELVGRRQAVAHPPGHGEHRCAAEDQRAENHEARVACRFHSASTLDHSPARSSPAAGSSSSRHARPPSQTKIPALRHREIHPTLAMRHQHPCERKKSAPRSIPGMRTASSARDCRLPRRCVLPQVREIDRRVLDRLVTDCEAREWPGPVRDRIRAKSADLLQRDDAGRFRRDAQPRSLALSSTECRTRIEHASTGLPLISRSQRSCSG